MKPWVKTFLCVKNQSAERKKEVEGREERCPYKHILVFMLRGDLKCFSKFQRVLIWYRKPHKESF